MQGMNNIEKNYPQKILIIWFPKNTGNKPQELLSVIWNYFDATETKYKKK
jgi:hypothetical protein